MSRIPLWTSLLPYITVLKWDSNMFSAVLSVHTPALKLQHDDSSLPDSLRHSWQLALVWPLMDFQRTRRYFVHHPAITTFLLCVTYYRGTLLDVHEHGNIDLLRLLSTELREPVVFKLTLTPPGTVTRKFDIRLFDSSRTAVASSSKFKCC